MAVKNIDIEGLGDVSFYKRKSAKSIKIRINGSDLKVTLPYWVPYSTAVGYVKTRKEWILANLKLTTIISDGDKFGKNITLKLNYSDSSRFSSRFDGEVLHVFIPKKLSSQQDVIQNKLIKYIHEALKREAEELILPLVRNLAIKNQFEVGKIEIKNLKSRWGSCSSNKDLAFSLFLIQLPWHCIEYVIFHELAHTRQMNHGKNFWAIVAEHQPKYKLIKLQMKQYSPHILPQT